MLSITENRIEEYKMLVEIYYKELEILYSKISLFITVQIAMLAGILFGYGNLSTNIVLLVIALVFAICLSISQIIISSRGYTVNIALIESISDFERDTSFNLLGKFQDNVIKSPGKYKKMNFPSLIFKYLGIVFCVTWCSLLIWSLHPYMSVYSISSVVRSIFANGEGNYPVAIIASIFFAVTMKIADSLDEHNMKWFKNADIVFGILCGVCGCVLINVSYIIANAIWAMLMGYVIRKKIDYRNHIIAFTIMLLYFSYRSNIIYPLFLYFFVSMTLLGIVKEIKYKQQKTKLEKTISYIYLYIPIIYAIPTLIYSIVSADWLPFFVFFMYDFSYNITRMILQHDFKNYYK